MHIAQLLSAFAGQTDYEQQIPSANVDEVAEQVGIPFNAVFLAQENPLGLQAFPPSEQLSEAVEQPLRSSLVPEGYMDLGRDPLSRMFVQDRSETKLPSGTVDGRTEGSVAVRKAGNDSTQESFNAVEALNTPDRNMLTVEHVSRAPRVTCQSNSKDIAPVQSVGAQNPVNTGLQQASETDVPKAEIKMPQPELAAKPKVPSEQTGRNTALQQKSSTSGWDLADRRQVAVPTAPIPTHEEASARVQVSPLMGVQDECAVHPVAAAASLKTMSDRSFSSMPVPDPVMQVETGHVEQSNPVATRKSAAPQSAHSDALSPSDSPVEIPLDMSKNIAVMTPAGSVERSVPELGVKTPTLASLGETTPASFNSTLLMPTVEFEAERQPLDDVGVRLVDQVTSSTNDLKSHAPVRPADIPRFVSAQIAEITRQQPDRPVELTLSPEELGRLRMSFQTEGSALHVILSFERPDTLDLMRRHIDQLAQEMRAFGMSEVSFTFQQQTSGEGDGAFPNEGSARPSNDQNSDRQDAPDDVAPIVLNVAGRAGVDMRV